MRQFHPSLIRPTLLLGCDRELLIFSALISFTLVVIVQTWFGFISGCLLWVAFLAIFRSMGKADPFLRIVYIRHSRYRIYYPARSTPFRINTRDYR